MKLAGKVPCDVTCCRPCARSDRGLLVCMPRWLRVGMSIERCVVLLVVGIQVFDVVVTHARPDVMRPPYWRRDVVAAEWSDARGARLVAADAVDQDNAVRHDPTTLARTIIGVRARHGRVSWRVQAASHTYIHSVRAMGRFIRQGGEQDTCGRVHLVVRSIGCGMEVLARCACW